MLPVVGDICKMGTKHVIVLKTDENKAEVASVFFGGVKSASKQDVVIHNVIWFRPSCSSIVDMHTLTPVLHADPAVCSNELPKCAARGTEVHPVHQIEFELDSVLSEF